MDPIQLNFDRYTVQRGKEMKVTYDLSIRFTADRELTEEELGNLQLQTIAQVEEPVDGEGEDVTYTTEFYGSDIDKVEESK